MIKTGLKQPAKTDILTNSGKKVDEEHVISKSQSSRSCRREREYITVSGSKQSFRTPQKDIVLGNTKYDEKEE